MWSVKSPSFESGATFDLCADRINSAVLRAKMKGIRQKIVNLCTEYEAYAKLGKLYLVETHKKGIGAVGGADLIKNYTGRMVGKKMPARAIYDALKILPRNDRCPFCRYGTIETLDHVLPKESYPGLSVAPKNLVGSCNRCNKGKHAAVPTGAKDCAVHPYFDEIDGQRWLIAEIVETKPAAALFSVGITPGFHANLRARVLHQFDALDLAHLYSNVATEEIAGIAEELEEVFQAGGFTDVAAHLERKCRSRHKSDGNSWQAALYEAMASSSWYCKGGFRTS